MARQSRTYLPLRIGTFLALAVIATGCGSLPTDPSDPPELEITNGSGQAITFVNISPCADLNWGEDKLHGTIKPGKSHSWQLPLGCYNLRAGYTKSSLSSAEFSAVGGPDLTVVQNQTFRWTVVGLE